jgi:opacity protein-like surface antigen
MKKTTGLLALMATLGFAAAANAQGTAPSTPLSIEVRGGVAIPQGDLKDDGDAKTGYTFGANATFQATPMFGVYAGWSRNSFGIEDTEDASFVDQGFDAGVKVSFAGGSMPVSPFVRGGVVFHKLSLQGEDEGVEVEIESDNAIGFDVGAGVSIPLGQRMSVTPALSYSKFNTADDDEVFEDVAIGGIRLDIGLNFRI